MRYLLKKQLQLIQSHERQVEGESMVEVLTKEEYENEYGTGFSYKILLRSMENIRYCKADMLQDCIAGTFLIPDKEHLLSKIFVFGYYIDANRLIFVDDSGIVSKVLSEMQEVQTSDKTLVAHFFFEFMEFLLHEDVVYLQRYEEKLTLIEERLLDDGPDDFNKEILKCRKELLRLNSYYHQLVDLAETLEENTNGIFVEEDCRLFHLFAERASRLYSNTQMLREYSLQIREMYQSQIDIRQNHVMQFLTIVTTIFMPLTLIAGWYGMNFAAMPELQWKHGYLVIIVISAIIIILEVCFFKHKKWFR